MSTTALRPRVLACLLLMLAAANAAAQATGATFGDVIRLGGTPSDIVLDEARGRLYLVNANANRVEVYDYFGQQLLDPIRVGNAPLAAAISMDGAWLYVTNNGSSTLSVIDLAAGAVSQTVSLPARPEGVEVGFDGRVLISTQGTGVNNTNNTLILFDRVQEVGQQVLPVLFPPPPPTPTTIPPVQARPVTQFRGKLIRTPDGQFIVGLSTINNNAQTVVYVYEVVSGVLLRSRTVTGQSTVLSMSPDGATFMAGFSLYETATLTVRAQANTANIPFPMPGAFNVLSNVGGSVFSPDGSTIYSAFNTAAATQPPPSPQSSILLVADPRHLGVRLGIKIPESLIAKMVITSDGGDAWGLSESGAIHLPLSKLYEHPILQPETTQVFLAIDPCSRGIARASLKVNNLGDGKLTFSVPNTGAALVTQVSSGLAPSTIHFVMEPGRAGVTRQAGTNLYTGSATNTGNAVNVNLISNEAINIPNTVRVYMNYRQPDQRGIVHPIPTSPAGNEGLRDMLLDEFRSRLYITNAGYNRIEVFDTMEQKFLEPIEVGQLPHQMALAGDGTTLYVGNTGGESIDLVDLDLRRVVGSVEFPPVPRAGNANVQAAQTLAFGLSGLQFAMAAPGGAATLWKVVGSQAVPREPSPVIGVNAQGQQITVPFPQQMVASADGLSMILLGGGATGTAYLYDALIDTYTSSRLLFNVPVQSYYGPLAVGPDASYLVANGLVLNSSLTVIGGAERPGLTQTTPAPQPGQPPIVTVVSGGQRNVASVAPVDSKHFVRLTTPVRQAITSVTRDEVRTTLELFDIRTGGETLVGVVPENPVNNVLGTARVNVPPRHLAVDRNGNAYAITISGLTVISLKPAESNSRPTVAGGARGVVNSSDGTQNYRPGSFITITGSNLAATGTADTLPVPTVLGGSCVVLSDVALPLLQTGPDQISAQIPDNLRPGLQILQVRSLATAQSSDPLVVTVQR